MESLLDAVERCSPEEKQSLDRDRQALAESLGALKGLKARQEELVALRLETTQKFQATVERLKDESLSLRAAAKWVLGPRNERLAHFDIAPVRARRGVNVKKRIEKAAGTRPGATVSSDPQPVV
jgi:hypothetical protein